MAGSTKQLRIWLASLLVSLVVFVYLLASSAHTCPMSAGSRASDPAPANVDAAFSWSVILLVSLPFILAGLITGQLLLARDPHLLDRIRKRARLLMPDRMLTPEILGVAGSATSVFSGVVHLGLTKSHLTESLFAGVLFALSGLWQLLMGWLGYPLAARRRLYLQLAFNTGLVAAYAASRLWGLPGLPDAPEPWDALGLFTKGSEILLIICLVGPVYLGQQRATVGSAR